MSVEIFETLDTTRLSLVLGVLLLVCLLLLVVLCCTSWDDPSFARLRPVDGPYLAQVLHHFFGGKPPPWPEYTTPYYPENTPYYQAIRIS